MKLLNVKVPEALEDLIDRAVAAAGCPRSTWIREALEAGASREIALAARESRKPGLLVPPEPPPCTHPPMAVRSYALYDVCMICQTRLERQPVVSG